MSELNGSTDSIELEPSSGASVRPDLRRPMFEPPPVRIIAVKDVHLPAAVGREAELEAFYVGVLRFGVKGATPYAGELLPGKSAAARPARQSDDPLTFLAENVAITFDLAEPPVDYENLAPTMLEVPSLKNLRELLVERGIDYETMHGLMPATEHVIVRDPGGNLLAISGWTLFS